MASGLVAKFTVKPTQISVLSPSASVTNSLVSNQISRPELTANISLPCTEAPSLSVVACEVRTSVPLSASAPKAAVAELSFTTVQSLVVI